MIIGEKSNNLMLDVRIFSKGKKESQTSIRANSGNISTLKDAFLLSLFNGEIHELEIGDYTNYRRIAFKKHNIISKKLSENTSIRGFDYQMQKNIPIEDCSS